MSHKFDLYTLRLFIAAFEEGSLAAAAEREHITASALSKRMSELERMLGTDLFIRRAHGVEPTKAAQTLARGARKLLHQANELAFELGEFSQGTRGHVRIAANLSSITQFLPAELYTFLERYPEVTIDLTEMVSTDVTRAVAENRADTNFSRSNVSPEYIGTRVAGKKMKPSRATFEFDATRPELIASSPLCFPPVALRPHV